MRDGDQIVPTGRALRAAAQALSAVVVLLAPITGLRRRHHLHESVHQRIVTGATHLFEVMRFARG
jgi:hypothetical protein